MCAIYGVSGGMYGVVCVESLPSVVPVFARQSCGARQLCREACPCSSRGEAHGGGREFASALAAKPFGSLHLQPAWLQRLRPLDTRMPQHLRPLDTRMPQHLCLLDTRNSRTLDTRRTTTRPSA
jgi:hypothetical protein